METDFLHFIKPRAKRMILPQIHSIFLSSDENITKYHKGISPVRHFVHFIMVWSCYVVAEVVCLFKPPPSMRVHREQRSCWKMRGGRKSNESKCPVWYYQPGSEKRWGFSWAVSLKKSSWDRMRDHWWWFSLHHTAQSCYHFLYKLIV